MKTAEARTLEQRLKFDHGLTVGEPHLVRFTMAGRAVDAMVELRGRSVFVLTKPEAGDMYSSWRRLQGDKFTTVHNVIVWGVRDPELMRMFDGDPAATVEVTPEAKAA